MIIRRTPGMGRIQIDTDDEALLDFVQSIVHYVDASDRALTERLINEAAAHRATSATDRNQTELFPSDQ